MNLSEMDLNIVRYGELVPCKTAFIDAHTPGSDRKENFTIIGGGVSESPDQHVHIRDTPGFNIGAAGQPPYCRNSLHMHSTAEVFFVLKGKWRFFWGRWGDAGEVTLEEGDIFTAEYMETLKQITDEVFYLNGVDRSGLKSLWTSNVRWVEVTEQGFQGGTVIPDGYDGSRATLEQLR